MKTDVCVGIEITMSVIGLLIVKLKETEFIWQQISIFLTQCRVLFIYQTLNSVRSNSLTVIDIKGLHHQVAKI